MQYAMGALDELLTRSVAGRRVSKRQPENINYLQSVASSPNTRPMMRHYAEKILVALDQQVYRPRLPAMRRQQLTGFA